MIEYKRWCVQDEDLANLTPLVARDLISKCFYEAQKETIVRAKQLLRAPTNNEDVQLSIETIVRQAFKEAGGDYEQPNKFILSKVVESLARQATLWHTPPDIIEHHKEQIQKVLQHL